MPTTDDRAAIYAEVERHSLAKSIVLHLPGVLMLVFLIIAAPLA